MKNILQKALVFVLILFLSAILASLYGILHNQISYSISSEYFTTFKFQQFGIAEYFYDRFGAAIVGVGATWWFGLILGAILGVSALILFKEPKKMFWMCLRGVFMVIFVAFLIGLSGALFGFLYWQDITRESLSAWRVPQKANDISAFMTAGTMHNSSYLGGILGLLVAIVWMTRKVKSNIKR